MPKVLVSLTLVALVFLGLGCKSPVEMAAEKVIEDATGGKVQLNTQGEGFTIKTEQGTIVSEQKLPVGFPSYIPIYQNSKLVTATTLNESAMYVSFDAPDSVKILYDWYKNAMKDWKLASEANFGATALLMLEKGTEKINISFTGEEGKSVFDASGNKTTTGAGTNFIINWTK